MSPPHTPFIHEELEYESFTPCTRHWGGDLLHSIPNPLLARLSPSSLRMCLTCAFIQLKFTELNTACQFSAKMPLCTISDQISTALRARRAAWLSIKKEICLPFASESHFAASTIATISAWKTKERFPRDQHARISMPLPLMMCPGCFCRP